MKARRIGFAFIALAAVTLISGWAFAFQNPPKKSLPANAAQSTQTPDPAQPKKRLLNIRAATAIHEEASNTDHLTNAVIEDMDEGTVFRGDQVKIDNMKSVKTADATGNLLVTDKQADVTGENVKVYFAKSKRLLVLTGKVVVQLKPKSEQKDPAPGKVEPMPVVLQNGKPRVEAPDPDDDTSAESSRKYPATITCDKLEYEYAKSKKHAVLTGNFKVVQKFPDHTRTLWADYADYYGLEDRVMLHAPVRWEDTKNDQKGSSPEDVEVYTKDGDERLKAKKIELTVQVEEEGDEKPPATKSGQKPPESKPDAKGSAKPDEKNPNPAKTGPDKKALH